MAGTGVLALARAMVDTGILPISIFYLGGTMAGTGVLALARAMVDTGPFPSSTLGSGWYWGAFPLQSGHGWQRYSHSTVRTTISIFYLFWSLVDCFRRP
jgi:hypothetical protein